MWTETAPNRSDGYRRSPTRTVLLVLAFFLALNVIMALWAGGRHVATATSMLGALSTVVALVVAGVATVKVKRRITPDAAPADPVTADEALDSVPGFTRYRLPEPFTSGAAVLAGSGGVFLLGVERRLGRVTTTPTGVRLGADRLPLRRLSSLTRDATMLEAQLAANHPRHLPVHAMYVFTEAALHGERDVQGVTLVSLAHLPMSLRRRRSHLNAADIEAVRASLAPASPGVPAFGTELETGLFDSERLRRQRR